MEYMSWGHWRSAKAIVALMAGFALQACDDSDFESDRPANTPTVINTFSMESTVPWIDGRQRVTACIDAGQFADGHFGVSWDVSSSDPFFVKVYFSNDDVLSPGSDFLLLDRQCGVRTAGSSCRPVQTHSCSLRDLRQPPDLQRPRLVSDPSFMYVPGTTDLSWVSACYDLANPDVLANTDFETALWGLDCSSVDNNDDPDIREDPYELNFASRGIAFPGPGFLLLEACNAEGSSCQQRSLSVSMSDRAETTTVSNQSVTFSQNLYIFNWSTSSSDPYTVKVWLSTDTGLDTATDTLIIEQLCSSESQADKCDSVGNISCLFDSADNSLDCNNSSGSANPVPATGQYYAIFEICGNVNSAAGCATAVYNNRVVF